jgi:predicted amidophosphoribosyltransferase
MSARLCIACCTTRTFNNLPFCTLCYKDLYEEVGTAIFDKPDWYNYLVTDTYAESRRRRKEMYMGSLESLYD